ncbi:UDP-N-acetylmuramate dehydrogenase [Thiorhodococcus mannitoliphagus]|uniref:UDP-N-acetylenolpyruvoylglucosamine reductase n=1 Tax=Thiorhodococcus mannitoliphagus TaxID=329406 RepID=A0A6P1DT65_9GAMM|nr:UDP-N-acetylmuramate dehydrogenase [Thiorhodococcus mannitoliphagus]NEX18874.1 UDP-N-acetylmuramate dehydrogenase [Thiorhodococcus mannitoliphagus]
MTTSRVKDLRGELLEQVPLSRYTSWRVGGPARQLYRPADLEDLATFLRQLDTAEPLLWIGLGSNLLIGDEGFPGTVILTQGCLTTMKRVDRGRVYAEAGVSCAKLARFAARHDLVGVEFLAGIPGTFGGALAMNAGAWGGETWPHVRRLWTIDRSGTVRERDAAEFSSGYREVSGPEGECFVAGELGLAQGDGAAGMARMRALLDERAEKQPIGLPSCGSVFRNPPGDHAARLIESLGLKGHRIGGAQVSEKHANFIINTGDATASDINALITHVRDAVERGTGIRLIPEVKRVTGEIS